jgi:WD40 repeat protein
MRRFFIVTLILLAIDSIHSQEMISPIDAPALEHIWNRIADNSPKLRSVESAEFSPDGLKCASVSKFGNLLSVWEVADGSLVLQNKLDAEIECVSYSPDGEQIACGDEAFYVTVWDAATSEQVAVLEHDAGIDGFTWSNDGQYLVAGTEKCDMWFWNPDT